MAINDAQASDVIVYPGTYMENLSVNKSIRIIGYDGPYTTAIDGSAGSNAVSIAQGLTVWLMGLNISSGRLNGVYQPTQGTLYLRNCIVCGNGTNGVYVECTSTTISPALYMDNCICVRGQLGVEWVICGWFWATHRIKTSRGAGCELHSSRPPAAKGSLDSRSPWFIRSDLRQHAS